VNPSSLQRSERYRKKRRGLRGRRLEWVEFAEGSIADEPTHHMWRRPTTNGHTLDYFAASVGFLIEFYVMTNGDVCLDDLLDLENPPIRP
jgi:hypothetical protein